jgi:hypothetical protein
MSAEPFRESDRQRSGAEGPYQSRMLCIKVAHAIDYPGVLLFRVVCYLLNLVGGHSSGLFRRHG